MLGGLSIKLGFDSETIAAIINRVLRTNLSFDFSNTAALPTASLFTRLGDNGAWFRGSNAQFLSAQANVARYDFNNGIYQGLLIEPATTNKIYNSNGNGAIAGTPGTNPNFWTVPTGGNGLTKTIVARGTENGMETVDIRFAGTTNTNSSMSIYFGNTKSINVAAGQYVTGQLFIKLVEEPSANITMHTLRIVERDAAGSFTGTNVGNVGFAPTTGGNLTSNPVTVKHRVAALDCTFIQLGHRFDFVNNRTVNVTFRYGYSQVETNTNTCSTIVPSGPTGINSRNADIVLINTNTISGNLAGAKQAVVWGKSNTFYLSNVTVSANGNLIFTSATIPQWQGTGERHLKYLDILPMAPGLQPFVNFRDIAASGNGMNSATVNTALTPFVYTLVDKELWPDRCDDIGRWGDTYMREGVNSIQAARNVKAHVLALASANAMRCTANQSYEALTVQKDYVSERNWAFDSLLPAYLKTKYSGVYTTEDITTIETWLNGVGNDIVDYYNYDSDTLSSKNNNHLQWGTLAANWIAVATSNTALLNWCVDSIKHVLDDTYPDIIVEDGVYRRMVGYQAGNTNLQTGNTFPLGGLQLEMDRANSSFFYPSYWMSAATITAATAKKNGIIDLFEYQGTYGNFNDIYNFWYINVLDGGNTINTLVNQYSTDSPPQTAAALNVATHSVDSSKFNSFVLYARLYPEKNVSTFIMSNLANGVGQRTGGDYSRMYPFYY